MSHCAQNKGNGQSSGSWAVILGASSGFGLASAHALASQGLNLCLVHRDRRGSMARIEGEFDALRATGVSVLSFNTNALADEQRERVVLELQEALSSKNEQHGVKVLLHSIAFGSLKLLCPTKATPSTGVASLADRLSIPKESCQALVDEVFETGGAPELERLASASNYNQEVFLTEPEIMETINAMGLSLLSWTRSIFNQGLFCPDGRVLGLT